MAGISSFIIIPGGVKTKKHIELGRYYLLYTCLYCGTGALSEQVLERTNRRSFMGLREQASPAADAEGAQRPGPGPGLSGAGGRAGGGGLVPGGKEGEVQILREEAALARHGKPWLRSVLPLLVGIGFFIGVYSLRLLYGDPATRGYYPLTWIPMGAMVLLSLGYILWRRRRLAAAKKLPDPPEYYGPDRLNELRETHGKLLKPFER